MKQKSPLKRTPMKRKTGKKKAKKKRLLSIPRLREKVCDAIKKYVKLRDSVWDGNDRYALCVTCNKMVQLGAQECHGGHFQHGCRKITYLMEDNIHVQCSGCNTFHNGRLDRYTIWMQKEVGEIRTQELIDQNLIYSNWKRWELDEKLAYYLNKLKEEEDA